MTTVTGQQIREHIANRNRGLVRLGKTTAGGSTTSLIDTRWKGLYSPAEFGEAFILITSGADDGHVSKIDRLAPETGTIHFTNAASGSIATGVTYEIWLLGIHPDDAIRGRDNALKYKCSHWRLKALSLLAAIESWRTAAYSATLGGATNSTPSVATMDFPFEPAQSALRILNTGADGYCSSEALDVQPGDVFRIAGWVQVDAGTASIRVRDLTGGADISLQGTATFTLDGPQYFEVTGTVPAGCGKIQAWPGGAGATVDATWSALSFLLQRANEVWLPSTVVSPDDVGQVYSYVGPTGSAGQRQLVPLSCNRDRPANLVRLRFGGYPAAAGPIFYDHRHFYAALQSDYLTTADRTAGDAATTSCPLDYAAAATVAELCRSRRHESEELAQAYDDAVTDLESIEDRLGLRPVVVHQQTSVAARPFMRRLS